MSQAGERVPLEAFLAEVRDVDPDALGAAVDRFRDRVTDLLRNLSADEDLRDRAQRLLAAIPSELAGADVATRARAARTAEGILAGLKAHWIEAENPPLVDEIDTRLEALHADLGELPRSDRLAMREAAARIDRLALAGHEIEAIERRFLPWALASGVAFLTGFWAFFNPEAVNRWLALVLLASPAFVATTYMWRVRHRSAADAEAERLNRAHFLPHGGLYFAAAGGPACVVRVEWTPPTPEEEATAKKPLRAGTFWWTRKE